MDFIKNVLSNIQNKCRHPGITISTTGDQMKSTVKTQIDIKAVNTLITSKYNNTEENLVDSIEVHRIINNDEMDDHGASKIIEKHDKNQKLTEDCIASEINLNDIDKENIPKDITKENKPNTISNTEIEFNDGAENKDELNDSINSDSILKNIELEEEIYFNSEIGLSELDNSELCKIDTINNNTELENACVEINSAELPSDPCKIDNKLSSNSGVTLDNDYLNGTNSEMLVSLEEFDRILQRYNNEKGKAFHWDPSPDDSCIKDENVCDPLSIDEIDEFITDLNETQPIIPKPLELINESLSNPLNEGFKDDVISISSEENVELPNDGDDNIETISIKSSDSDCSGYHSSDFEFISEKEAKMNAFIINFLPPKIDKSNSRFERPNIIRNSAPGPSNSSNREGTPDDQDVRKVITINEGHRPMHEIPEGEDFLNLFQGIYNPVLPNSEIFFLENKSVRITGMHVEFEGLGFDRQMADRRRDNDSDDEFEQEAQECRNKIISMYPGENRKRRRRF